MKRRSANCMLVVLTSFSPERRWLWIVCLQRWVLCIVYYLASRVGQLRHLGTLQVQSEKHRITVFTPHMWSQQNYITVLTLYVYSIRNYITVFTLQVQSHGTKSQFSHCTCRVMALHHIFYFKHFRNSTPDTTSFFGWRQRRHNSLIGTTVTITPSSTIASL